MQLLIKYPCRCEAFDVAINSENQFFRRSKKLKYGIDIYSDF